MKLPVNCVAYKEASPAIYESAIKTLESVCPSIEFEQTSDSSGIIFFASGGSESEAIKLLDKNTPTILLAGKSNNSWASATEVKAYAGLNGYKTRLLGIEDPGLTAVLSTASTIKKAYCNLAKQRLGLIGDVSDWLVASDTSSDKLKEVLGVELVQLAYDNLPEYLSFPADQQFLEMFPRLTAQHDELGSISSFLKDTLAKNNLDALTIQCFKMVREKHVTACLPVAICNFNGIPAGCEGDITTIASIMLIKELTGQIAWMANMAAVHSESIFMAHCTVPIQLAESFEIKTHYETDESAAIEASLDLEEVTIFRMNKNLDKAFIAEGVIIDRPNRPGACRTQIEVSLPKEDINKLVDNPLGNHHLVIKGHVGKLVKMAMGYKKVEVV